jgi:N-methylhydantoinase A/oxoprolinase/acetone carboxylase beta subunit
MRYRGQEHAVRVPLPPGAVTADAAAASFDALHRRKYTFDLAGEPAEVVTCHVAAFGGRWRLPPAAQPLRRRSPVPKGRRRVDFDADGVHEATVYERADLPAGFEAAGPLVVEDETTTVLVHPGQALEVDEHANLLIAVT